MAHQHLRNLSPLVSKFDSTSLCVHANSPDSRLDLRPGHDRSQDASSNDGRASLPPPLAWENEEHDSAQHPYRNRLSRLFDVNRLRQATVEEQMAALRQLREHRVDREAPEQESAPVHEEAAEGHQSTRISDKLKEKFRILTRSQPAQQATC